MATLAPAVRCVADGRGIAASDYEVVVNPFAFAIDVDGRVQAKGLASDPRHLSRILEQAGIDGLRSPTDRSNLLVDYKGREREEI